MTAIFNKSNLEYVKADVPETYLQGQTHVGIEYVDNGYLGYTYWLSASPYANFNVNWENPCVYYANERDGGLPPINFTPHVQNPFQTRPPAIGDILPINSDPAMLYIESKNEMVIINRATGSIDPDNEIFNGDVINYQKVPSLLDKTEVNILYTGYEATEIGSRPMLSPSLIEVGGKIRSYHLSVSNGVCFGLSVMEADSIDGRKFKRLPNGSMFGGNIEPWHLDVFQHGGKFYSIVCGNDWSVAGENKPLKLYLAESSNGFDFYIYKRPLLSANSYRSSAFVRGDGMFIMYASVVDTDYLQDPIYSVDGREILLGYMDFNELLGMLQTNV